MILTGRSEAAAVFAAVIIAPIEAVRVSLPELGLMNPLSIALSYARGAVPVRNIRLGCPRVTPLYSAQKTLEFHHSSSTPEPNDIPETRMLPALLLSGAVHNIFAQEKQTRTVPKSNISYLQLVKGCPPRLILDSPVGSQLTERIDQQTLQSSFWYTHYPFRGIVKKKVEPLPGSESTQIRPS